MSTSLNVENIAVSYGNIKAIKGISLKIEQGDIVSLIGANGAGKSTLLKAVMGLVPLTGGQILFQGSPILTALSLEKKGGFRFFKSMGLRTDRIVAAGMSLVPEGRRVFTELSVLENLELGAFLTQDKAKISHQIAEQFDYFPILKERAGQKAGSLSGGEQQMLAIARALMSSPRLLLLDEPGLGLAPLIVNDIFNIIRSINQEKNVTIFLVEQNAKKALEISRHGYVMENGLITLGETSENLLNNNKVKAAYLGEN